ncbi:MAG: ferredoxin [Comamonadaceae bacterium]|nr:MAG: ferredoxin [Comamonadaceae bacterium]
MVGTVGSEPWPAFRASSFYSDGMPDPLDRWSRSIGQELAQRWDGVALFPFDGPPYHPFQQWASRAETLHASPLMLHIHPEYGLWHSYRFALALPTLHVDDLPDPDPQRSGEDENPCLSCDGKPCLQACPVQAYTGATFLLEACADHLSGSGAQDCLQSGCLARRACPLGREFIQASAHAAFHMEAFTQARSVKQNRVRPAKR